MLAPLPSSAHHTDVVKSHVQLTSHKLGPTYIFKEFGTVIREGGNGALFRGLSPTLLRAVPAAAATFTAFELTKGVLEGKSADSLKDVE